MATQKTREFAVWLEIENLVDGDPVGDLDLGWGREATFCNAGDALDFARAVHYVVQHAERLNHLVSIAVADFDEAASFPDNGYTPDDVARFHNQAAALSESLDRLAQADRS